jgi:hypothetical protein
MTEREDSQTLFEESVLAYVAAWSEVDEGKRRMLLETGWAENGIYIDPTGEVSGREALVQHIGRLLQQFPGDRILLTSGIDEHHGQIRFTWVRIRPDGNRIREGIDIGEMGIDGRLIRMIGFFGPPPPIPPSWSRKEYTERRDASQPTVRP